MITGEQKNHSYSDALIDNEYWVQNVSGNIPTVLCKEQDVPMSLYRFESEAEKDMPSPTLGDGGDLEEVSWLSCIFMFKLCDKINILLFYSFTLCSTTYFTSIVYSDISESKVLSLRTYFFNNMKWENEASVSEQAIHSF